MNKKILLLSLIFSIGIVGCSKDNSSSNLNTNPNSNSSISSKEEITNSSSIDQYGALDISEVRNNVDVDEIVTIRGVVVKHNYTGQSTPYITGFWVADSTGSIYIYGENVAKSVEEGNKVVVKGKKCFYIPQNDTGSAASMNYTGMMQLKEPELLENDNAKNSIPDSVITETTIADINNIPLSTNITGNIYKVKGRYSVVNTSDFTNYYINDLNRKDSLMAYTQSNGKDYKWTNEYDGKTVEMLIIVSIAKPGVNSWRFCPVEILDDDVKVSAEEEATYAAERALDNFSDTYNVNTTVEFSKEDQYLEGSIITISSESNQIEVNIVEDKISVKILASTLGKITLKASVSYEGALVEKTKDIEIVEKDDFDTITISEVREKEDGEEVTIEAVVAKLTYKSSMTKQGLFLVDNTGSLFAYFGSAGASQLEEVEDGYKVVLKATVTHYIKNAENASNENYDGDFQLSDGEILNIDKNVYDIPLGSYTESTIATIASTEPSNNITGNIYKVTCKVVKNTGYSTSYSLYDLDDTTKSLPLYSQNSGNDFKWLDEYVNQEVTMLVAVQNLNLKASGSFYRGCPIQVL